MRNDDFQYDHRGTYQTFFHLVDSSNSDVCDYELLFACFSFGMFSLGFKTYDLVVYIVRVQIHLNTFFYEYLLKFFKSYLFVMY